MLDAITDPKFVTGFQLTTKPAVEGETHRVLLEIDGLSFDAHRAQP